MSSHSRGAKRPGRERKFSPQKKRAQGKPGARCTRGLVCKVVRRNAHEHTGSAESIRPSLRNGFTAYAALSPATNSSCHRHRRIKGFVAPGWADENLRRFDTSNGCQDHTVLPYAAARLRQKASPGFGAVVLREEYRSRDKPALRLPCAPTLPRPPHPVPTFVTMANAPLLGPGWDELVSVICPTAKAKYFCKGGWTENTDLPVGQNQSSM